MIQMSSLSKHLATVTRKNALLTGKELYQNQAYGEGSPSAWSRCPLVQVERIGERTETTNNTADDSQRCAAVAYKHLKLETPRVDCIMSL